MEGFGQTRNHKFYSKSFRYLFHARRDRDPDRIFRIANQLLNHRDNVIGERFVRRWALLQFRMIPENRRDRVADLGSNSREVIRIRDNGDNGRRIGMQPPDFKRGSGDDRLDFRVLVAEEMLVGDRAEQDQLRGAIPSRLEEAFLCAALSSSRVRSKELNFERNHSLPASTSRKRTGHSTFAGSEKSG
jgi:hypothetical protein